MLVSIKIYRVTVFLMYRILNFQEGITRMLLRPLLFLVSILLLPVSTLMAEEVDVIIYGAPPYIVEIDNEFHGITIRAIEAAFAEADLKVKFHFYPYARSIAVCYSEPNCVWVGSFEGLGERISGPLYQVNFIKYSTTFFYNHKEHPEFENIQFDADFSGKTIGVLTSEFDNLKNFEARGAEIITLSTHKALFQMLQSKRIDFAHYVDLVGQIEVLNSGNQDIRRVQQTLISSQGGLLFKNRELAEKLYKAFVKINSDGRLLNAMEKELGKNSVINLSETIPKQITMSTKTAQSSQ